MKILRFTLTGTLPVLVFLSTAIHALAAISDQPNDCFDNWTATRTTNAPTSRWRHTAIWTGTEMIIWGGELNGYVPVNTGGRYNPITDSWVAISTTNAPTARFLPTAVWTGTEMIVWGGDGNTGALNTGGRYNPSTDTWTATSTINAPTARLGHTAVWTGSEMIVWGGQPATGAPGGRYNPTTDSWTATSTTNAPSARYGHTAVWTGSEMIVWGGFDNLHPVNSGGRYNLGTDSWTPTSTINAPSARQEHTAVWTGSEMIVWGGFDNLYPVNSGGRYNPSTDSWTATSTINAPSARDGHTAVWTDSAMIVWGGCSNIYCFPPDFNTGGRYNLNTDSWTATSTTNTPTGRYSHTAVWAGREMIVWGGDTGSGFVNSGGRYCAQTGPPLITLDAHIHRQGGKRFVALTWSPADGGSMSVLRNGVLATTDDDGTAQDKLGTHTGTFYYQVCEPDSGNCSNEVRVVVQ